MRFRIAIAILAGCLLIACDGGGPTAPPTAGPTPTRAPVAESDKTYARSTCSAFAKYLNAFNAETQKDPQIFADQAKLLRVAAPILETFGKDLDRANPPKDMANFHDAIVEKAQAIAKKAKAGSTVSSQELGDISKGAPLPPSTVRARMIEAAEAVPECAQSGGMDALFGDTGQ